MPVGTYTINSKFFDGYETFEVVYSIRYERGEPGTLVDAPGYEIDVHSTEPPTGFAHYIDELIDAIASEL